MIPCVFKTRERRAKMKMVKTNKNFALLLLFCLFFTQIREDYLPKLAILNPHISLFHRIAIDEKRLVISILDLVYEL